MLIFHQIKINHTRAVEWVAAAAMIGLGLYFMLYPGAFYRIGMVGFADITHSLNLPVETWMWASILLGMVRIGALILNGRKSEVSAPLRFTGAALGAALFAGVSTALIISMSENGAAVAIPLTIVLSIAEIYSAIRAINDTNRAMARGTRWIGSPQH